MNPSICRSAEDATQPCRFVGRCHESRQRLQHRYGLRGKDCWAFELHLASIPYEPTEREAIQEEGA